MSRRVTDFSRRAIAHSSRAVSFASRVVWLWPRPAEFLYRPRLRVLSLQENVPLAPLTTIGIGGPARFFFRATSVDELREALAWAAGRSLPVFILGGGS